MGYQISNLLFFALVLFSVQFSNAYAYQSSEELQARGAVALLTIVGTIITIILFKKNEWFEDKWYFASSYQKMLSIGIGVPLWIAIFAILFEGYLIGLLLIITSCIIIAFHVRRWKRRKIGSTYQSRSYDEDKTYQNQSRESNSNPYERTHYKEKSDHKETSGRQQESKQYNEQTEEEYEEEYEDEEYEEQETSESPLKKYYDVLEISENASPDEIKKAYKRLVRQWHPDTHKSSERKQMAEKEMKKINEAYDMLEKAGKTR